MTTGGEGGMLTTNDETIWQRAWSYKDHGKRQSARLPVGTQSFRWLHDSIGTNWRLTEMQSAIGRVALRKVPEWVACRRRNASILSEATAPLAALRTPRPADYCGHSYYRHYTFVQPELLRHGWNRDRIVAEIHARGVPCGSGSCGEIYLERAFPAEVRPRERLRTARLLSETSLALLVHPTLTDENLDDMCCVVEQVMTEASR